LTPEEGALARGLSGQETNGLTFTLQKPGTAQPIWVEVSGRPVRDGSGRVVAAVAVYRDVTERKQQLRQLRRSDQINRAILQHLPNGAVFLLDRDLRYVSAEGPLVPDIMRRTDIEGLVGRRAADVISPANREVVLDRYRRALAGESSDTEIELDGRYFDMSIVPILEGKEITHALIATYDVTDRRREVIAVRQARDALTRERALFEITLAHILDGVALIDGDNRILLANHAFAAMLGLAPESVLGLTREGFVRLVAPLLEQPEGFAEALAGQPEDQSQEFIFAPPRRRILTRSWTRVPLADGGGILVTWHDVTAERDLLRERERLLLTDLLTGIPNRRAADLALRTERERMKRAGTPMCVALFDIDHFKKVNDGHGHGAGDELLRLVAGTLAREARLTDTIARWGGEEFLAILNFPLDGARVFCERARLSVERLCCPPLGRVTISAGVAEVAAGESSSDAIAQADRHLYDAKNAGRNRVAG
jgi:diguanylate cyclase (GGDEF)-like protein/PAS domain S-box-containing protein